MANWVETVKAAIARHVADTGSITFTRPAFIAAELDAIVAATGTTGLTPSQTLGRELQQLRDAGLLAFDERGHYRWLGAVPPPEPVTPSHAVFVLTARADRALLPERGFVFDTGFVRLARQTVGQWVIYEGARGYGAVARVDEVAAEPGRPGMSRARVAAGSYLEFGRPVSRSLHDRSDSQGTNSVPASDDPLSPARPVQLISAEEFDRIMMLGLVDDDAVLPRRQKMVDGARTGFMEDALPFAGFVDRETLLVSRKVRDKQFRRRVLDAYDERCALTGMKLINGGGRAETEAAHIMSVGAGGPDAVNNGIALSGTVHWMFDRGLISLTDGGDILLSRAINDRDSVERLIHRDRKARLPTHAAQRPHPRYLHWHRTECFHD